MQQTQKQNHCPQTLKKDKVSVKSRFCQGEAGQMLSIAWAQVVRM